MPLAQSKNHICFYEGFECIRFGDDVYRASISNTINTKGVGGCRHECSVAHAKHYTTVYPFLVGLI